MRRPSHSWIADQRGAVAPTVALSLIGLIGMGGIAFDYARMATLDTELQDAADQAALAAATQLDGGSDAITRATAAAQSLLRNTAIFADATGGPSGDTTRVTVPTTGITFYSSYDETADTGTVTTSSAAAKVVMVTVDGRQTSFAWTPIVRVYNSGNLTASAVAGLDSSICKVPPLMICAPNTDFPQSTDLGKGVTLEPGGGGAWVPGNYGYLDFGNGASGVSTNLGKNNEAAACADDNAGIPTEPGNKASVTKALNTRFDLYAASSGNCDPSTGDYCPSENTRKDLAFTETVDVNGTAGTTPANPGCGASGAKVTGKDNNVDSNGFTQGSPPVGFPRDNCHIAGTCGKFGDGVWDRTAFLASAHPGVSAATIAAAMGTTAAALMRWDVYQWELADKTNRLQTTSTQVGLPTFKASGSSGSGKWTFTNRCAYPQPHNATGVAATSSQKDRRLLTVAVVDCTGANGKFNAQVLRFADIFLVEPSLDRTTPYATGKDQIYGEIVRVSRRAGGQSAFQYYLRQRARLLK